MAIILDIDHEAGDLSEWDYLTTDGGDMSAAAGAALAGSNYGMSLLIDDTNVLRATAAFTPGGGATSLRFRFYIDPNSLTMANGDSFLLLTLLTNGSATILEIWMEYSSSTYQFRVVYRDDAATTVETDAGLTFSDAEHYVEVLINRATTDSSSDADFEVWIDGGPVASASGVDLYDAFNDAAYIRMGAHYGIDAGTSGTFYLDEIVLRDDDTEIGPVSSGVTITPAAGSAVAATVLGGVSAPVTLTPSPASAVAVTTLGGVSASLTLTPDPASALAGSFSLYGVGAFYFEVAVDLDGDGDWSGEGEDLTGCVHGLDLSNGMSAAYQTLGKSQATLTLINVDGRFSPEHENALSGFTLGRVVRVRVSAAGSLVELFRGAITKIDPRAGGKGARRCTVTCEGWLSRMRQQPFELPLQTSQRADQIAAAIIEAVGAYPPGYGSEDAYTHFETGVETFPYFADNLDDNARVYDALRVLAASEATGRFFQERDGRLRFWDRRYLMKRHAVQATFEDTMAEMDYAYGAEIRNQVVVKYHPRQYEGDGPYVLSRHDEGIKFRNAQEEKEIYLRYSDESDITVSTSNPITPERRVDFWGNNKEDGSGDLDFSGALSVSAEHFGTYSKWTVGNGGLSFCLAAGATQRGADRITDRGRQEVRRSDDESIASYGLHPHTIDTQAQPSHNVARALAYWTVGKFSQPRGEIKRLTIRPLRDAALRAQAVERQIGDRIRLKETQTGVDADYFIVGERWRVGEGAKEVEVSWVVEPAAVHQCLLLGVTGFCEMGSNSRMGY